MRCFVSGYRYIHHNAWTYCPQYWGKAQIIRKQAKLLILMGHPKQNNCQMVSKDLGFGSNTFPSENQSRLY